MAFVKHSSEHQRHDGNTLLIASISLGGVKIFLNKRHAFVFAPAPLDDWELVAKESFERTNLGRQRAESSFLKQVFPTHKVQQAKNETDVYITAHREIYCRTAGLHVR